jgi:signal transduction histidine kinase
LHDTILQSMQAIILHVHAARGALAQDDPVRFRLDQVIGDADRAYAEGRDQVTALRVSPAGDIESTIADTGDALMRDDPRTTFEFRVGGERARLRNVAAEELAEIAREAIRNAFRHAEASRIDVMLDYGVRQLTLTARDNGKGMAGEAGEGHWGLVGIRERAARIRAELTIDGTSAPGTRIVVKVASRHAYADRRRAAWRR